jgi:hypothetical protein
VLTFSLGKQKQKQKSRPQHPGHTAIRQVKKTNGTRGPEGKNLAHVCEKTPGEKYTKNHREETGTTRVQSARSRFKKRGVVHPFLFQTNKQRENAARASLAYRKGAAFPGNHREEVRLEFGHPYTTQSRKWRRTPVCWLE